MKYLLSPLLIFASLLIFVSCDENDDIVNELTSAEIARGFYQEVIVEKNMTKFNKYIGDTYKQHAPAYADGVEPLREELQANANSDNKIEILRVVGENDYAALHSLWTVGSDQYIYVDIWRVEDGKLVEHWDQYQSPPSEAENDNTMHAGPDTNINAQQNISQNKERAIAVLKTFDNLDDLSAVENFVADEYIQHNPTAADKKTGLLDLMAFLKSINYQSKTTIAKVIAQGDMVVIHSKVEDLNAIENAISGVIDIFRFDNNGMIIEHWDVIETMTGQSLNNNDPFEYPN
ncbi:Predicted SnoaL-like aldol condensation-catalyzing enzyme [Tenacibaculum sp. MAR_2009_124]|uniref:nuclear transport factor 2 family protein n=1 Tax=Tenacibaculum sp. MAR_2009_124 TaxID=1250059 RepID=UPI0008980528|nr:nuclear transport factor 2 family protein [Tenacibaculum sp. MAR_2009_124]SEB54368.1 Predicted SnoaL-like aldol condensation-catalyzing enzyme [Tenacibaculum sp. MAR_2009_124]